MPNTGNTQQIINYGATANDGTGDPLRTAFIKTDENFDNVWLAGPVGSNITISNNTIQTNNTNGNIILKPNGTGIIQANASIIPNSAGTRDLGSSALSWRRAYIDELLPETLTVSGDASIGGNLTVQGNTIQIGNITTDTLTIQLANTAGNKSAANGAGITVGANDAIATFLFNSTSNTWVTNIGANVGGNVTASYFIGNGSQLTGITGSYSNANVANYLPTYSGNISAGNISVTDTVYITKDLYVKTGSFTGDSRGENSIYAGVPLFTVLGSDVVAQFSANVDNYTQFNFQNGNSGTLASGDFVITANNGDDETFFFNMGLGSNNHSDPDFFGDTSTPNDAYIYVVGADATGPGDTGPGNLLIGSTNGMIKMFVGNTAQANVVQTITTTGVTMTGNIIPSANAIYSLGNSTNYWANLWVANNTIYIGGVPVGMTAGNVLTVDGNAITGTVTFSNEAVIGTGTSNTVSGLYLAPDPGAFTDGMYLRVRGNTISEATHIHFDTGNNQYFSQFIGDDNKYVELSNTGNIVINTSDYAGNTAQWMFGINGRLTFPHGASLNDTAGDSVAFGQDAGLTGQQQHSVAIGPEAGGTNQGEDSVAIGWQAGRDDQADFSIAIGWGAGKTSQAQNALAHGRDAGSYYQQPTSIAIGQSAGRWFQGQNTVAIGYQAGRSDLQTQQGSSVPAAHQVRLVGGSATATLYAGMRVVGGSITAGLGYTIATVLNGEDIQLSAAPPTSLDPGDNLVFFSPQGLQAVAIGDTAGYEFQGQGAVAIGVNAGRIKQGLQGTALGEDAGETDQGQRAVAVGYQAAQTTQGQYSVAMGYGSGQTSQGTAAVAMGWRAGQTTQGNAAVAIGEDAGRYTQGAFTVAIGHVAGESSQGNAAVAIGNLAGRFSQGDHAVAVGDEAGNYQQGQYAVAMGYQAGYTNQGNNSIILNATGSALTATANTFTVAPIRNDVANVAEILFYDTTSKEITYGNTISVAGNITGGNISTTGNITGNIGGFAIGYRDIPQVSFTGNATIATADAGKHFYSTQSTDYILTIANNSSQGFQTGAAITVINQGTGNITLAQGSGVTLYLTGNATSGNRTVTTFGMATLIKVATDTWFVSGAGVI